MPDQSRVPPLRDGLSTFFRYKWRALAFFLLVIASSVAVILLWPRKYESQARLFVRVGRESVALDPTATTGKTVSLNESRENEINSVVEMLSSRRVVELAVDKLGPEMILADPEGEGSEEEDGPMQAVTSAISDGLGKLGEAAASIDPLDDRERAVQDVIDALSIDAERKSSVVNVAYKDKSPEKAQTITAAIVDAYLAEHLRVNRTHGSQEFFDDQSALMRQKWDDAAEALRDAKDKLGIVTIDSEIKVLQEEAFDVNEQLVLSVGAQTAAEARVAGLEETIAKVPERKVVAETDGHPNMALDRMREKLYELEISERELLSKFTEENPQVIAIQQQVRQARLILTGMEKQRVQSTTSVNPAREKLEQDLHAARVEEASLVAKTIQLRKEHDRIQQQVKKINASEVEIARLEQQVQLAEANFRTYAENLEQARIDQELENQNISNVNLIQPASLQPKPASPRKGIVAVMGLALAFVGSIAVVILSNQFDYSLKTPDEVERQLDIPVLMTLPRTSRTRSLAPSTN